MQPQGVFLPEKESPCFIDPYGFQRTTIAEKLVASGKVLAEHKRRVRLTVEDMEGECNNFMDSNYFSNLKKAFASQEPPFEDVIEEGLKALAGHRHEDRLKDQVRTAQTMYHHRNPSAGFSPFLGPICSLACASTGSDEPAFWALCYFVEQLLPDYHDSICSGVCIDTTLINFHLPRCLPRLHEHLKALRLGLSVLIGQWLYQGFAQVFPSTTTVTIWNHAVHNGGREFLLQIVFATLHLCEVQLLETKTAAQFATVLQQQASAILDFDNLLRVTEGNKTVCPQRSELVAQRSKLCLELEDLRTNFARENKRFATFQQLQQQSQQVQSPSLSGVSSVVSGVGILGNVYVTADEVELCFSELSSLPQNALVTRSQLDTVLKGNGVVRRDVANQLFDCWGSVISDGTSVGVGALLCSIAAASNSSPLYRLRMCFDAMDPLLTGSLTETQLKSLFYSPHWRLLLSLSPPSNSATPTPNAAAPNLSSLVSSGNNANHTVDITSLISTQLVPLMTVLEDGSKGLTFGQFVCFVLAHPQLFVRFVAGYAEMPVQLWQPGNLKPRWVPNNEARRCIGCGVRFTLTTRRHHCRNCGYVFCSRCCAHKRSLSHHGPAQATTPGGTAPSQEKVRVCDACCIGMVQSLSELVEYM